MQSQHKISEEKWASFNKGQQVLMIANEINRAKNLINKSFKEEVQFSYQRAIELIDLTLNDKKWNGRLKELLRCREVLAELFFTKETNQQTNQQIYNCLVCLVPESYNMLHPKL